MNNIKNIKEVSGSIKVITDVLLLKDDKNMPVIVNLNFDYYVKDSIAFLGLLLGQLPENRFESKYGNHDIFEYDQEKNILTKKYSVFKKGLKEPINAVVSFNLTKDLKQELIQHITNKYNEYVAKIERDTNAKANKTKSSKQLEIVKSINNRESNIQQQEGSTSKLDTKIKSEKELRDFSTFNNKMEIDTYLRTNADGTAFIKWLQDNKLTTLNQTYAVSDLMRNKSMEELVKLREEYLK